MSSTDPTPAWQTTPRLPADAPVPASHGTLAECLLHPGSEPVWPKTDLARLRLAVHIAESVATLHAQGVICGDLAPQHIRITGHTVAISPCVLPTPASGEPPWGTPLYLAPELAVGLPADPASDTYALGAILAHLLRGEPPFVLSAEPAAFWHEKRAGPVPAWPESPHLADEVHDLLIATLVQDPQLRPSSAMLRAGLENALDHADAITRRRAAQYRFENLTEDDRDGLAQVIKECEQIAEAWPEDFRTRNLLRLAHLRQARHAVAHGEVSDVRRITAGSDLRHDSAVAMMEDAAVLNRRRQRRRAVLGWSGVILLILAVLASAAWLTWRQMPEQAWRTEREHNFRDASFVPTGLASRLRERTTYRALAAPDGHGLELPIQEMILVTDTRESGDVRITADIQWLDRIDGFEFLLHASDEPPPEWWMLPKGLHCQFGGFHGLVDVLSPKTTPGVVDLTLSRASTLRTGVTYRLSLEIRGDQARMAIDGQTVLSHRIPLPLIGPGQDRIALRSWSRVRCLALRIERTSPAEQLSPPALGDALLLAGQPGAALATWQRIAADRPKSAIAEVASARGYQASLLHPETPPGRAWFLDRLRLDHPGTAALSDSLAAEAALLWRNGQRQAALAMAHTALDQDPASSVALRILDASTRPLNSTDATAVLRLLRRRPDLPALDLRNLGLDDIAPLRGMRTRILNLGGNRIADLGPLAGMPLVDLNLTGNAVSDISVLSSASQLRRLRLGGSKVTSIATLRGLPIDDLNLSSTAVSDLGPLAGLPLRRLTIDDCPISDLTALRGAPLEILNANRCSIRDLAPLNGSKLYELNMAGNSIADLSPLVGMPLRRVDLSVNQVVDLSPLAGMPIDELNLSANRIVGIGALAGMPLRDCNLADNAITDLAPLTRTSDGASRRLVLDTLRLDGNPLVAVEALGSVQSSVLTLVGCGLRQMPQGQHACLDLSLNPLDAAGEPSLAPARLYAVGSQLEPARLRAWAVEWERQQADPVLVRHLRAQAAALAGDVQALRALATPAGDQRLISVASQLTFAQAMKVTAGLGAQLPRLPDTASEDVLARETAPMISAWLGLQHGPAGWAWQDGSRTMARPLPAAVTETGAWHFYVVQGMRGWAATPSTQLGTARASLVLAW